MRFRSITPEDYESVREFLAQAGWQDRVSDPERFKKMLENTNRTVVAVDDSRVVGFARALCDEVSNGYISMVAVAPDHRMLPRDLRVAAQPHGVLARATNGHSAANRHFERRAGFGLD